MRPILAVTINYIYMERTYVFNQEPNGGGSKFDIMALLPNLMGGKGVDPGLLALLNQGRNNQDAWGGGMWWIWIILLWFSFIRIIRIRLSVFWSTSGRHIQFGIFLRVIIRRQKSSLLWAAVQI